MRGMRFRHQPEAEESATLSGQVLIRLREDLKANRFKPDERLRFERMKQIYDVGIAPLREALARLAEVGLVVQLGQKGFRVAPASLADLRDVVETRRLLEVRAFEEAVIHGSDDWEGSIVAAFHQFSKTARRKPVTAGERADWEEHHTDFHRALLAGCPNLLLLRLWSVVFDKAERYRRLALEIGDWSQDELGDHARLLEAALARKSEQAGDLLYRHIGSSAERLIARLGPALVATADEGRSKGRTRRAAS
jgi:GntR family carbon starvation induced transcriptional regulator